MSIVDTIISNAMLIAQNKSNFADAYTGVAIQQASGHSIISPGQISGDTPSEPRVAIPTRVSGVDTTLFDSMYGQIIEDLSSRFHGFLTEFFPIRPGLMPAVEEWLERAITQGGTGINSTVERQIWQRDRDRITAEAASAMDEAVGGWAARGYPLPPGAANASVMSIQKKRMSDLAAVSRDAAIKAFETEVENVRFAIAQAIDYRTKAIAAAGDYIRALASAPDIASKMSTQSADAQARLISAAASYYGARIDAAKHATSIEMYNMDHQLKSALANQETDAKFTNMRTNAAVAAAESMGQQAAAALNGLNATAQLQESVG
jgi:hypothetical protein